VSASHKKAFEKIREKDSLSETQFVLPLLLSKNEPGVTIYYKNTHCHPRAIENTIYQSVSTPNNKKSS
jgi:mRNA deadenylase 3'-5' endonuclease subunit Ccr4